MSKCISSIGLTETLNLAECNDGWWLYDSTRGHNIAMRARSKDMAFVEALGYYQKQLKEVESAYRSLNEKVNAFCYSIVGDEED